MQRLPIASRLVIRPKSVSDTTESGLVIPEVAREKALEGEVVLSGPDAKTCKPGDWVWYTKYAGTELAIEDASYLVMHEEDVLLVESRGQAQAS